MAAAHGIAFAHHVSFSAPMASFIALRLPCVAGTWQMLMRRFSRPPSQLRSVTHLVGTT